MPFIAFVLECIQNNCQVYTYHSDTKTCTFALSTSTPVSKPGAYSAGSYCYPIKPWRHPQAFIDHPPDQSEIPLCKNDFNFGRYKVTCIFVFKYWTLPTSEWWDLELKYHLLFPIFFIWIYVYLYLHNQNWGRAGAAVASGRVFCSSC